MIPDDVIEEAERLTRLARDADRREASSRANGETVSRDADRREASDRASGVAASRDADHREASGETSDLSPPFDEPYAGPTEAERYRQRRDDLLAAHGYVARVRSEDTGEVLVCHPGDWLDDDTVVVDRVDPEEAVERRLSGTGDADRWEAVETHNRAVAEAVEAAHGDAHGYNAHKLADFASNHYAKPLEDLTPGEREEFLTEYYPRNGWPSDEQRTLVAESVELARERADAE
ncbi:hypothetical protein BRC72_12745 [Halobacteriales archaeon QH_7_66_36]|nr:MAG: hypothetical protein BRC72_12745 [Halobacteriales archaeon QH_7_66_36]